MGRAASPEEAKKPYCKAKCLTIALQHDTIDIQKLKGSDFVPQSMLNIRMDTDVKKAVEEACVDMGLSMTTLFTVFAKKVARERRIPFEITGELPKEKAFQIFMEGVNGFSDDFMADGRENEIPTERESL